MRTMNCQYNEFRRLRAVDTKEALAEAQRWAADASGSGMVHTVQAGDGSVFWRVYYHSLTPGYSSLSQWWLRFYEYAVYLAGTDMSNLSLEKFCDRLQQIPSKSTIALSV